jgi:hypothetical protein
MREHFPFGYFRMAPQSTLCVLYSFYSALPPTFGLLQFLNEVIEGLIRSVGDQIFEELLHELVHLVGFQVPVHRRLELITLLLVHLL